MSPLTITLDIDSLQSRLNTIRDQYDRAFATKEAVDQLSNTELMQWAYRVEQAAKIADVVHAALTYQCDVVDEGFNPGNPDDWDGMGDIDGRRLFIITAHMNAKQFRTNKDWLERTVAKRRRAGRDD